MKRSSSDDHIRASKRLKETKHIDRSLSDDDLEAIQSLKEPKYIDRSLSDELEATKRLDKTIYTGKATMQDLPLEILWKIIEYVENESVANLCNICKTLSDTLTIMFHHKVNLMMKEIEESRNYLHERLYDSSLQEETMRLTTAKSMLYLDWIQSEFLMFEGIVLRYDVDSKSSIFPQLWIVIVEMLSKIHYAFHFYLSDIVILNPGFSLRNWTNFCDKFDQELEPNLGRNVPFEVKIIDIITCCPSANAKIEVKQTWNRGLTNREKEENSGSRENTVSLKAYFQIQDICNERHKLCVSQTNDIYLERAILKFLRSAARRRNVFSIDSTFDELRCLENRLVVGVFIGDVQRDQVITQLEEKYKSLTTASKEVLEYVENKKDNFKKMTKQSSYNVSCNYVECSLENNNLSQEELPLIFVRPRRSNKDLQTENIPDPVGGVHQEIAEDNSHQQQIENVNQADHIITDIDHASIENSPQEHINQNLIKKLYKNNQMEGDSGDHIGQEGTSSEETRRSFNLKVFCKRWWRCSNLSVTRNNVDQNASNLSYRIVETQQID